MNDKKNSSFKSVKIFFYNCFENKNNKFNTLIYLYVMFLKRDQSISCYRESNLYYFVRLRLRTNVYFKCKRTTTGRVTMS